MSTYDGAYSKRNSDNGAKVCSCYDDRINDFCYFHGKYKEVGSFKQSEEQQQLKKENMTIRSE